MITDNPFIFMAEGESIYMAEGPESILSLLCDYPELAFDYACSVMNVIKILFSTPFESEADAAQHLPLCIFASYMSCMLALICGISILFDLYMIIISLCFGNLKQSEQFALTMLLHMGGMFGFIIDIVISSPLWILSFPVRAMLTFSNFWAKSPKTIENKSTTNVSINDIGNLSQ